MIFSDSLPIMARLEVLLE